VLIFAQHPALKSIAAISIIGIVCVFVMSQTLQPFLFDKLISGRARKQFPPITLFGFFISSLIYFYFGLRSIRSYHCWFCIYKDYSHSKRSTFAYSSID